jgi:hypothetical protein
MKTLFQKIKKPTNKRTIFGSNVAKVGAGITVAGVGISGGVEFFEPNILELLPPNMIAIILIIQHSNILIGTIISGIGLIVSAAGVKIVDEVKE